MTGERPRIGTAEEVVVDEQHKERRGPARLLLTNDDGIDSPGLRALAARLADQFAVVVAAPASDMSGSGTGIGRFDPRAVPMRRVALDGVEAAYAVDGPPGLAVMAAALGAFGDEPDVVVSGINAGMNTGHSIIHSGTVGAVLTARTFGSHGVAVSLAPSDPWEWETAAAVAHSAVRWILPRTGPRLVLNVNVPGLPADEVKGIDWADMDEFGYFRVAVADLPGEKLQFEVVGERTGARGTDTAVCLDGRVAMTLLSPLERAEATDQPATAVWRPEHDGDGTQPR